MTKVIQTTFSSGEISPQLYGRVDLEKYKNGLALCKNFFVDYRGGVSNRAGTSLVGYSRSLDGSSEVRLIPFQFSVIQTYILEFSNFGMRVIMNGGQVTDAPKASTVMPEAGTNYAIFNIPAHGYNQGDTITGVNGTLLNLSGYYVRVIDANSFYLNDLFGRLVLYGPMPPAAVARVYTLTTPWAAADLALLKFTQSADTMTLVHPNYPPYDLHRLDNNNWQLVKLNFNAEIGTPGIRQASVYATNVQENQTYYYAHWSYKVTAVNSKGQESVASPRVKAVASNTPYPVDISLESGYADVRWTEVDGASYYNLYRSAITTAGDIAEGASFGLIGNTFGTQFLDRNSTPDFTKSPPLHKNPFAPGAITDVSVTAGGSGYNSDSPYVITDPTGKGAVLQPVFLDGSLNSMYVVNGGSGYTKPTLSFPSDGSGAAATLTLGPKTGVNPGCCTYFQQRKYFAGSLNAPDTLYASIPGQFQNFDQSIPSIDSDALELPLVSNQLNNIKHLVGYTSGLVVLTGSSAWLLSGGSQQAAVTPTNADAKEQVFNGCSDVPPLKINYNILYVQNKGSIVRSLEYNFYLNIFTGIDMSILSSHLFAPRYIKEWTYQEEPFKLIWCVMNDGTLLSFTFLKDQEVYGWARHETAGIVESVCSITEGLQDFLYMTVIRTVFGRQERFLERMESRLINGLSGAWFVDSGLSFSGAPAQSFSGLTHLENATVSILADGKVLPQQVVMNGQVTLATPASNVVIGLPYSSKLQTLPLDAGQPSIQGSEKQIQRITVKVNNTLGVQFGEDFDHLQDAMPSYFAEENVLPYSGNLKEFTTNPVFDEEGQMCLQVDDPVPCTILAIVPDVNMGDTEK